MFSRQQNLSHNLTLMFAKNVVTLLIPSLLSELDFEIHSDDDVLPDVLRVHWLPQDRSDILIT